MKKTISLVALATLLIVSIAKSQTTNFSFTNKPFSDPEMPNYHRGAHYWNGTQWDNSSAPQVPPGTSTTSAKTWYARMEWTDMESSQGVYTFTKASLGTKWWASLENSLEWCANNGALWGFGGVMTAYDGSNGKYYDGAWSVYPQYLHNLMQSEINTKDWIYTSTGNWIPNWNSPSYLERWRVLNDTILKYVKNWKYTPSSGPWAGKLIEGPKIIDFIDLRGYGNFGEWHTYPWTQSQPANAICTDSSMKKIIDIAVDVYGDYPIHVPIAIFDDNGWSESNAFRTWYVMTRKTRYGVIGWRRDNIGDKGYDNFLIGNTWTYGNWKADTAILDRWKYAMITGEPLNGSNSSNCCPIYFHIRPEISSYHYASFGNGNYGVNTQAAWDTINAVFKLTGYRYNLNGGNMTTTLSPNQNFNVTLNWRNVGASPLYQKRWRIVYQLKTAADVEVKRWTSKLKPYLFLPSNVDSIVTDQFNLGNVPNGTTYKLTVKFEDTVGLLSPLFIAINSPTRNTDGSYTLRSNIVVTSTLPVNWISFTGVNKGNYNELKWKTSCNDNNQKYELEKSIDGNNWDLWSIISSVNKCLEYEYSFNDYRLNSEVSYYRIKQYDLDGRFQYSNIIKVLSGKISPKYQLVPNPVENTLSIAITDSKLGHTKIDILDTSGKLIHTIQFKKETIFANPTVNTSKFSMGLYTVRVSINGEQVSVNRFVKN